MTNIQNVLVGFQLARPFTYLVVATPHDKCVPPHFFLVLITHSGSTTHSATRNESHLFQTPWRGKVSQ
jgi:hypothetical protein